jgi:hypothetical protein|tara:strand:+ start:6491 stop:7897 length:1407 start_codon:yes stop_codon:yes gene_type:complete
VNIIEFLEYPDFCGDDFNSDSWESWKAVLSGAFALPMDDDRLAKFKTLAGDREPPQERVKELYAVVGRRAGKTHVMAATAVYLATVGVALDKVTEKLSTGERCFVTLIATDKEQAKIMLGYISGIIEASPALNRMVVRRTTDAVELNNRVTIQVTTGSYRAVRGRAIIACLYDELAFFRNEAAALPDDELYRATVPALATTGGLLIGISSPYAKKGLLYQKWRKHYGKDDDILVVMGGTRDFNPTVKKEDIDRALEHDPDAAKAEWLGQWREGITDFIDRELVQGLTRQRPLELPYDRSNNYVAFCDPSGGGADAYTVAIAHLDKDERVIIDLVRAEKGQPADITGRYADVIKDYRCYMIQSDAYAGSWPRDEFSKHRVRLEKSELSRSELYQFALPVLRSERVQLPNDQQLIQEFANLERRTSRAGRDIIDHPQGTGFHDDMANACAGAIYLALQRQRTTTSVKIAF